MARLLITGGNGFVGKHVVRLLCQRSDVSIIVLSRQRTFGKTFAKNGVELVVEEGIFGQGDDFWDSVLGNIDTVLHLAWADVSGNFLDSKRHLDCCIGTLEMVRSLSRSNVKRFVGVGTCHEYKFKSSPISSSDTLAPVSNYAAAKAAVYLSSKEFLYGAGIQFAWCRPFYLFGEGEPERRLYPYLVRCFEEGVEAYVHAPDKIRDFLDVEIAAQKIVDITLSEQVGAFNICSGAGVSIKDFALSVARSTSSEKLLKFSNSGDRSIDPDYIVGVPY